MSVDTDFTWNGDKIIRNVNAGTIKALIRATNIVQNDATLLVAKRSTDLEKSIVKDVDKKGLIGTVSTNMDYAFAQEFGRPDLASYSFTPYMRPALNNNIDKINSIFIYEEKVALDK